MTKSSKATGTSMNSRLMYTRRQKPKGGGSVDIFRIVSKATGREFVGWTPSAANEWGKHREKLRSHTHPLKELQAIVDEHGIADLTFTVLFWRRQRKWAKNDTARWVESHPNTRIFQARQ